MRRAVGERPQAGRGVGAQPPHRRLVGGEPGHVEDDSTQAGGMTARWPASGLLAGEQLLGVIHRIDMRCSKMR